VIQRFNPEKKKQNFIFIYKQNGLEAFRLQPVINEI